MPYGWEFSNTTAGRTLKAVQLRGKATIKEVAADLGVTVSAVRLHLSQLQARGAIHADKVHDGVGRPYYLYSVTPEAHNLLYKDYGNLARLLLEEVARTQGPEALQAILGRVGEGLAAMYRDKIGGRELAGRVRAWADLLNQRGVAVQMEKTEEGYVLREYGCPYQNVAADALHRAVCEMERQVMSRLLESGVKLSRCILDGHNDCQFTVPLAASWVRNAE